MKIFKTETLNTAIMSVFKNKSDFFSDRKQFIDLIIKNHNDFFKEIRARRKKEFELLQKEIKLNKLSISEALEKMRSFNESYENEKKSLINNKGNELLKEYNEKYNIKTSNKNFINEPSLTLEPAPAEYKELLKYEKEYGSGMIVINFFSNEDKELKDIGISVRQKNGNVLNSIINLGFNKKDMILSSFNIPHKNIYLEIKSMGNVYNSFLMSLKEEDLLSLDSKEKEEYFSMLFDFKLDLKDEPLYDIFKMGMAEFMNTVKNELKQKNNLKI